MLYGGLGRHQVERLAVLRRACERVWEERAQDKHLAVDFPTLFQDVLAMFDARPDEFAPERVRDELIGQMAEVLDADYNALVLDVDSIENRQRVVTNPPKVPAEPNDAPVLPSSGTAGPPPTTPRQAPADTNARTPPPPAQETDIAATAPTPHPPDDNTDRRLQGHIVSPAPSTERLQAIQQLVAEHTGESVPDFADNVLRAIPVQAGGLFPISDVWYIEPGLDTPDRLRIHIAQFAREIAEEAHLADCVAPIDTGIGFVCAAPTPGLRSMPAFGRAVLALLHALSTGYGPSAPPLPGLDRHRLDDDLALLLQGPGVQSSGTVTRLSDNGLVKLFRMLRLARRLLELTSEAAGGEASEP